MSDCSLNAFKSRKQDGLYGNQLMLESTEDNNMVTYVHCPKCYCSITWEIHEPVRI